MYDRWKIFFEELVIIFREECLIKHNNRLYNGRIELTYNGLEVFLESDDETPCLEGNQKNISIDILDLNNNFTYILLKDIV